METFSKDPFEASMKLAKNLADLDILAKVKQIIDEVKEKPHFTYKVDENFSDIYHIFYDNKHIISQKFPEPDMVTKYIGVLEYGFMKGVAFTIESLVDSIKKDMKGVKES